MRTLVWICVALCATTALAGTPETWDAHLEVASGGAHCDHGTTGAYTFARDGIALSANNPNGQMFSLTLLADGKIMHEFHVPLGEWIAIRGNINVRTLEIVNASTGCTYRFVVR